MAIERGTRRIAAAFLIQEEDLILHPYRDSEGNPTIGVGHLLSDDPKADLSQWEDITREEALDLLTEDVEPRLQHVVDATPDWTHTADKLAAMTSLAFNIGRYGFARSFLNADCSIAESACTRYGRSGRRGISPPPRSTGRRRCFPVLLKGVSAN